MPSTSVLNRSVNYIVSLNTRHQCQHGTEKEKKKMKIIINLLMLKPAVKSEEPFLFNRKTSCVQFMAQFKQERNMTGLSSDCCTTFFPWSHGGPPGRA